ncbi:cellulose biosynthesis protein BcsG [Jejubacter calystegiae]|uniref:Cellulose biosynthesis protein BcsG n=1 Tax=Jejubacter calystegiae TaxID=2579935 RepID=A0A4P8YGK3_9ENTR|nr:cellulose biosynthesis protein BcsG [Jejubacter calystegiae]QCT18936.1 cellulose biosynthesis protein BcsG [Jejubacter calystegiae]
MTEHKPTSPLSMPLWQYWRGLSGWNFYFLAKFALLWTGYLNFHALENLVFAAYLLFPLPNPRLHRLRHWVGLPIGFALFWHDTWLPGLDSMMSQGSQVAGFSWDYILDLTTRFINWQMVGAAFVLLVAWLFISQWVRVTVLVVAALIWLNVLTVSGPVIALTPGGNTAPAAVTTAITSGDTNTPQVGDIPAQTAPASSQNLTAWLNSFYASEAKRQTQFPASLPMDAQPFELLVINICSLAWSDMEATGLTSHPLWSHFDILFKEFNSATSYSGPAAIRLLRASCGQSSHKNLYSPAGNQCYLFDNLAALGFSQHLMLDHDGVFGDFLKEIRQYGGVQSPLMNQNGLPTNLLSFDNSPIYDDTAVLQRWLSEEGRDPNTRSATFFNLLPLHDGNHFPGISKTADYKVRAQKLFDQLDNFLTELEKSGRKVMVVVAPEHGGALKGDKMQVSGLRDIPSPSITHVPVGVKFIGMKAPHQGSPIEISQPSSYLAISELVARSVDGKNFVADQVDWNALTSNLPQTAPVSENANAVVIQYQGKPWVRLGGGDWVPYPQ